MRWMVVVLALLAGCAERWEPDSYPAEVVVLSHVTESQRQALIAGVEAWNARLERPVFTLRFAPTEMATCDRINVVFTERMENRSKDTVGEADIDGWKQCQATVRLRPEAREVMARAHTHELGHVMLGRAHSDDPGSVMYWRQLDGEQVITDEDAEHARHVIESRSD